MAGLGKALVEKLGREGVKVVERRAAPLLSRWTGGFWISQQVPEFQPLVEEALATTQYRPSALSASTWGELGEAVSKWVKIGKNGRDRVIKTWGTFERNGSDDVGALRAVLPDITDDEISLVRTLHDKGAKKAYDNLIQTEHIKTAIPIEELEANRKAWYKPRWFGDGNWSIWAENDAGNGFYYMPHKNEIETHLARARAAGYTKNIKVAPKEDIITSQGRNLSPEMIRDFVRKGTITPSQGQSIMDEMKSRRGLKHLIRREDIAGWDDSEESFTKAFNDMIEGSIWSRSRAEGFHRMSEIVRNLPPGLKGLGDEYMRNALSTNEKWTRPWKQGLYGWHLGMKFSFFLGNSTQSFLNTLPEIIKYVGVGNAPRIWASAGKESLELVSASFKGRLSPKYLKGIDPEVIGYAKRAVDEGIVKAVHAEYLSGLSPHAKALGRKKFQSAVEKTMTLTGELSERGLRMHALVAGLKTGKMKGLQGETLYTFAKNFVNSTQFPYGPPNTPISLKKMGGWGELFLMYRTFSLNQMNRMMNEVLGSKEFTVAGHKFTRTIESRVAQALTPFVLAGTGGIPAWQMMKSINQKYSGEDPDVKIQQWIKEVKLPEVLQHLIDNTAVAAGIHPDEVREKIGDVITHGVPGMVGIDPQRWIGLGQLPFSPHDEVFGVVESMPKQIFETVKDIAQGRGWDEATRLLPSSIKNVVEVMKWKEQGGVRAPDGELIYTPAEWDRLMKALGIPSLGTSKAYEARRAESALVEWSKRRSSEYAEKIARARFEGNTALARAWVTKLQEENVGAPPHRRILVSPDAINRRVMEMRRGRSWDRVPKRMRTHVRKLRDFSGQGSGDIAGGRDR